MPEFQIQDLRLRADFDPRQGESFGVKSIPRPYTVEWLSDEPVVEMVTAMLKAASHPLVYIDARVRDLHLQACDFTSVPLLEVQATEALKTLDGALELTAFLDEHGATKSSTVLVIGGGIVQDVAGFACCIYKRGIPWVYLPTTFLAQADSGMGGKAGLNYRGAKNILALFSAPRRVVINTGFLETLTPPDILSGLGEAFRLHVTGGAEFLAYYEARAPQALAGDRAMLDTLLVSALSVKRAVIEEDEFETDIRRAMNYGHSLGHAFEALTAHALPHGTAVVSGMLVENELSVGRGLLSEENRDRILASARPLLNDRARELLHSMDLSGVVGVLGKDKKSEGAVLKLALLRQPGYISFEDFPLTGAGGEQVAGALRVALSRL